MPKGKKHTPEQIVAILRRIDSGEAVEAVCREINMSEATPYRWKQQYSGMEVGDMKELKNLWEDNARFKRIVADHVFNNQVLKEVNATGWLDKVGPVNSMHVLTVAPDPSSGG